MRARHSEDLLEVWRVRALVNIFNSNGVNAALVFVTALASVAGVGCGASTQLGDPASARADGRSRAGTDSSLRPTCYGAPPPDLVEACCPVSAAESDLDHDGVPDRCEDAAAERFAPVVYHSRDESNFPTNVDWLLAKTSLSYYDDSCAPDLYSAVRAGPLTQASLLDDISAARCGQSVDVVSSGSRSDHKHRTFFLHDLDEAWRVGSTDSREWVTYVHVYPSTLGGMVAQYWRAYAYNDASIDHGGDWEGVQVHLDDHFAPTRVWFLGHAGMEVVPFENVQHEGTHMRVFSEGGGHASHPTGEGIDGLDPWNAATYVRQESWSGGSITWFAGDRSPSGGLRNVGEKTHPLNGQVFIQYSGLWGSPGTFYWSSGYWGPAFNETAMNGASALQVAWCHDMLTTNATAECYANEALP